MSRTALAADPFVQKHDPGPGHPEQPARYAAVMQRLESAGVLPHLWSIPVIPATDELLTLVHTEDYVALVEREIALDYDQLTTGDTQVNEFSAQAARVAAGSVVAAVDAVFQGDATNAFCLARPPGHHASQAVGMGFCLFNNIAIGARRAQRKWNAERVLIVDWDVHHGNGTQNVFYEDNSVFFFSTHQSPWYPGTGDTVERGKGAGEGYTINCPLPAGSGHEVVFQAVERLLLPAVETFRPDLIMISAGFDSRIGDPLGHFRLSDADFREFTSRLMELADRFCNGRLVSVLEGGYNLGGLASACAAHVGVLAGTSTPTH
jgi:acetoin utilization deacetylase AcuC-like enzyme